MYQETNKMACFPHKFGNKINYKKQKMPEILTIIYLFYSFLGFYFLFLYSLVYVKNKREIFSYPESSKDYSLSIVVPCYNEEKSIGETIEALLNLDYRGLKKIIVVDDCSTDNSFSVIKKYSQKYHNVIALKTPKNTGKAAGSKNFGAKFVDTELIGFVDADSYPQQDSVSKMIGFFDKKDVAAVTACILVKKKKTLIEKLQSIEYRIIVFSRKILGFLGAIYVTPGPLAIYRKSSFDKIGGFDEKNLTEDIEITWRLLSKNYQVEMCVPAKTYTTAPDKIKKWYNQRIRWNLGGLQTISKYRKFFTKKGILGSFVLPFFLFTWVLGLLGIGILIYRGVKKIIVNYLITKYSIEAQTAILTLKDINLTPNILFFFGALFLILNLSYMLLALFCIKEKEFKNINLFTLSVYSLFYVLTYPFILITSLTRFIKNKKTW